MSARNDIVQFDAFHAALDVSNNLASERDFSHELILCNPQKKEVCWRKLIKQRHKSDDALKRLPQNILPMGFMTKMLSHLVASRRLIDVFRSQSFSNISMKNEAIKLMMESTEFYHKALFNKISAFLSLEPGSFGATLRAQALGDLRDSTGKLGAQLLIPLATQSAIPPRNIETIYKELEHINTDWWVLQTEGREHSQGSAWNSENIPR